MFRRFVCLRCGHPRAAEAFAAVSSAWKGLRDPDALRRLDGVVSQAKAELLGWRSLSSSPLSSPSAPSPQPSSAAEVKALDEVTVRGRVTAILLEAESRDELFKRQMEGSEAHGEAPGANGVPLAPAGRKGRTKRGRKSPGKRRSNFVKPDDPSRVTRHLHVANTGATGHCDTDFW